MSPGESRSLNVVSILNVPGIWRIESAFSSFFFFAFFLLIFPLIFIKNLAFLLFFLSVILNFKFGFNPYLSGFCSALCGLGELLRLGLF